MPRERDVIVPDIREDLDFFLTSVRPHVNEEDACKLAMNMVNAPLPEGARDHIGLRIAAAALALKHLLEAGSDDPVDGMTH